MAEDYIPVDLVQIYAKQGMSDSEIAARLQAQGFSAMQIDRAIKMALRSEVTRPTAPMPVRPMPIRQMEPERLSMGPPPMPREMREPPRGVPRPQGPVIERRPQTPYGVPPERFVQREPRPVMMREPPSEMMVQEGHFRPSPLSRVGEITVEEIVEGIVDEKWDELEDKLQMFEKRNLQLQSQIDDVRKKIGELEKSIKDREQTLVSKFDEFGESMSTIEGRIGGIEKVFREVLPDLSENIKVMSDIVEKMKK